MAAVQSEQQQRHGAVLPVAIVIVAMYAVQGSITGLAENTLPQLLNRGNLALEASQTLALVKLPAALKVLFAPLVDFLSQRVPGGYRGLVVALQVLTCAGLLHLARLEALRESADGNAAAGQLRWPLFSSALLNALGDLALDAFALVQFPERLCHLPALCQVAGVFMGKTAARSGLFLLLAKGWLSLPGFVTSLGWLTAACALCVGLASSGRAEEQATAADLKGVLVETWSFTTQRPNMLHWLIYQFMMPTMYIHGVTVLASRYEQRGLHGEDYAAYDLLLAVVTLALLLLVAQQASDPARPLAFFMKMYVVQAVLIVAMLMQYSCFSGAATPSFKLLFVVLNKAQELLFFAFEVGEFAFYGRVALLAPRAVASLVTLQACAFNFADFLHSWLAPALVDAWSSCSQVQGQFSCSFDAYPPVGGAMTAVAVLYLATQWRRIDAYQDLKDGGWSVQEARRSSQVLFAVMLAGMMAFTTKQVVE